MPVNLSPRAVRELNVALVHCFQDGAGDAITALQEQYSADGTPLATPLDLVHRATINTAEAVFLYPELAFELAEFGKGDATPEEGVKLYEHRQSAGDYKGALVVVKLESFLDDTIGQYRSMFYKLGGKVARAPMRLVEKTIHAACTGTTVVSGIDGKPLFSQEHLQKPGEAYHATRNPYVSNDIVQAAGMTFETFSALYSKFMAIPDEDGVADESNFPQFLWGDTDYLGMMMDICHNDRPSTLQGGGNKWKGKVQPMPIRRLQGTGSWGLASAWDALDRPINYVEREPLQLRGLYINPEDSYVRKHRRLEWQVDGRITCGAGHYRKIIRSRKS